MKGTAIMLTLFLFGSGCTGATAPEPIYKDVQKAFEHERDEVSDPDEPTETMETSVVLPIDHYAAFRVKKAFGEYIDDRFRGYHVADDIEPADPVATTPVYAMAEGTIDQIGTVSGYGGFIRIEHIVERQTISAIYGHLDVSASAIKKGDAVSKGQQIAILGTDQSPETDGERKHLHFGLFHGTEDRVNGYAQTATEVNDWINPHIFFTSHGLTIEPKGRRVDPEQERGGDILNLSMDLPPGWEVEWIPSIQAWNLFALEGEGTARNRSQVLIRYFDAADFLTLSTVTIHETTDLTLEPNGYTARRYDIEKKPGVPDFPEQPSWRNTRHIVTDFRGKSGETRYYVVAANPELDPKIYETLLDSMRIEN